MNATAFIIALNCAIYCFSEFGRFDLSHTLGLNLQFLYYSFLWQPLSTMFMHANLAHLLMNMAVLYQFGGLIERSFGVKKFMLIYFLGGIATSLLSFIYIYLDFKLNSTIINLVGASGAISVLMGVVAFFDKNSTKGLLIAILIISFAPMLMGVNVAWYAHIIGFGLGYFVAKMRVL